VGEKASREKEEEAKGEKRESLYHKEAAKAEPLRAKRENSGNNCSPALPVGKEKNPSILDKRHWGRTQATN